MRTDLTQNYFYEPARKAAELEVWIQAASTAARNAGFTEQEIANATAHIIAPFEAYAINFSHLEENDDATHDSPGESVFTGAWTRRDQGRTPSLRPFFAHLESSR